MILAALVLAAQLDACHVLTKEDVAAVQGEAFTEAKVSAHGELSTCFYQLPTFSNSISVDVLRDGARKYWEENFEHERERESEEPEEKEAELQRVRGVGSEAFWVGARGTGSLFVRKGDAMVRVSVGGGGSAEEKIRKSKLLALRALKNL